MTLLTKFIYGSETNAKKTPFGLLNNQIRIDNVVANGGWYNGAGERLGSGDLTIKEMQNISKHIDSKEVFFVLSEIDSGWDMPGHLDQTAPGVAYVMQNALWVIARSSMTSGGSMIFRIHNNLVKAEEVVKDGVKYIKVPRPHIYKAFGYDPSGNPIPPAPKPEPKKLLAQDVYDKLKANPPVITVKKPLLSSSGSKPKSIASYTKKPLIVKKFTGTSTTKSP